MSKSKENAEKGPKSSDSTSRDCFAIMPISTPDGYEHGHFDNVYNDLIYPACEMAGFVAHRADKTMAANCIHIDIIHRIIEGREEFVHTWSSSNIKSGKWNGKVRQTISLLKSKSLKRRYPPVDSQ